MWDVDENNVRDMHENSHWSTENKLSMFATPKVKY